MNERIKELALQAGLYHKVNDNNFYPTNLSAEQSDPTYQKFAELIVYECMEQVHYTREDMINGNISQVIKDRIEKHFGVEE